MADRLLLIDNDIFILLAGAGQLEACLELLGFTPDRCRRLPALEPMLRKPAKALAKYPAALRTRALEACARIPALEAVGDPGAFAGVSGIDDGEAVLLGTLVESDFHFLASNDKRALTALAKDPALAGVRIRVCGRIYCLELVLQKRMAGEDPVQLAQAFAPVLEIDKRLMTILSPAQTGRPEDCLMALESFLGALIVDWGADFLAS